MTDISQFYYELKTKSTIADSLLTIAKTAPESKWFTSTEQSLILLDNDTVCQDPVLVAFIDKFDPENRIMILRTQPNTAYSWHRDMNRFASINMLLEKTDSLTMFGLNGDNPRQMLDLVKVPYPPNTFVLMNVSERHAVYNFNQVRYMFSLSVPKPHTYTTARNYLIDSGY